ncbi:MAG: hypothetical protein A2014_11000 [Spirochaetes bacterium GWF1_49_6]|nr:MAG: hypothetical protein A2014_11000 [Spirochaetes bacterium GWF1_49_6]
MKNFIGLSVLVMVFSSCGLFFIDGAGDQAVSPLALTGGATLSTDDHNEKCPYVLRTFSGTNYLFFSSDRNGSYDIFVSIMDKDGNFSPPVAIPAPVNYTNTKELYPVVLDNSPNFNITVIRISNAVTNVYTYTINQIALTNSGTTYITAIAPKGLSYLNSYLVAGYGNNTAVEYFFSSGWVLNGVINLSHNVNSVHGIYLQYTNSDSLDLYIEGASENGSLQLTAEGVLMHSIPVSPYSTNLPFNISTTVYQSKFNDISPFIDHEGGFKVYFASDRYGKGNFDLYRYNIYTYTTLPEISEMYTSLGIGNLVFMNLVPNQLFSGGNISFSINKTLDNRLFTLKAYCALDNGPFTEMSGSTEWTGFFSSVPAGNHTVRVYAIDVFQGYSKTNVTPIIMTN